MISELNMSFSKSDVLQVAQLRTRTGRRKKGLVIVEGLPEFKRTVEAKAQIERLYICEEIVPLDAFDFKTFKPVLISKDEFAQIAFGSRLKGVLAFCRPKRLTLDDLKKKKNPLILVLESIEKPGNLGTILRSCDAVGVDAVICCDQKTEIYNQHVVRSSIGSVFSVSVVLADKKETIEYLQKNKVQILTTSAHAKKVYNAIDFRKASAIVIGSEHNGVSKEFVENANEFIKIPMRGVSSSLNAAMSASILCFEADRQRRKGAIVQKDDLKWDEDTKKNFDQMIDKIPGPMKGFARNKVLSAIATALKEENIDIVGEKELVDGFFKATPFGFHGPMKGDMESLGIDYSQYGHK